MFYPKAHIPLMVSGNNCDRCKKLCTTYALPVTCCNLWDGLPDSVGWKDSDWQYLCKDCTVALKYSVPGITDYNGEEIES